MGPCPTVDHKAVAKQGVDEASGGEASEASVVDRHQTVTATKGSCEICTVSVG